MKKKVFIEPAGCNRRKLDIATIRSYLKTNNYELVQRPEDADKIIVTTCAFKKLEENESIQRIRHFKKYNSEILVYGCLPDIARERYNKEFADIPKVAPREIEIIEQFFPANVKSFTDIAGSNIISGQNGGILDSMLRVIQTRPKMDLEFWRLTRASIWKKCMDFISPPAAPYYLFICRGCVGKCTYCAIRRAIGPVRSKTITAVVQELKKGIDKGYRDFTILGDDPGCYGIDIGSSLPELLKVLFTAAGEIEKNERDSDSVQKEISFHFYDIHPKFLIPYTDDFLAMDRFSSVRSILCPIQAGSNRILELMQREHTVEDFEGAVKNIYAKHPEISLDTEIIIGFPSETEEEFQMTLDCVVRCGFNSVIAFPYDAKDGTESSLLPDKIPQKVIKDRMHRAFKYFAKFGVPAYYKGGYAREKTSRSKKNKDGDNRNSPDVKLLKQGEN
ncbi:MAG: radical SAM protein [Bacteroidetes bacterium]|nr:radical SAM protein [Bacteroidota bacterium]